METNIIYNEDCIEGMDKLPDKSVDMVLTDIPYGVINREDNGLRNLDKKQADILSFSLSNMIEKMKRIVSGSIYIFCSTKQVSTLRAELDKDMSTRIIV